MIYILIFFLGIYIVFIALTLRYAQSFKLKNKVVDWIEQHDGDITKIEPLLTDYLIKTQIDPKTLKIEFFDNGDVQNSCYYGVTTLIHWDWPFFGIEGDWDIYGETKKVYTCNYNPGDVPLEIDF